MSSYRAFAPKAIFVVIFSMTVSSFFFAPAGAAVILFETPTGSTLGGKPVDADATVTTSANTIQVMLTNNQADPVSAIQCISGFRFHVSTGETVGSISSSSGVPRAIISDGTFSDLPAATTGWLYQVVSSDIMLNDLGGAAPKNTIVGPPNGSNVYASGNPSITGGSHNPHIGLTATFTLNVPGVTSLSTITSAIFQFNTAAGDNVTGVVVPEPASLSIAAFALAGVTIRRRRA